MNKKLYRFKILFQIGKSVISFDFKKNEQTQTKTNNKLI